MWIIGKILAQKNQTDSMEKKTSQEREEISIIFSTARKVLEQRV